MLTPAPPFSSVFSAAVRADLDSLKSLVQAAPAKNFENAIAELFSQFLETTFAVAKSGSQGGADSRTAGRQGRELLIECKRYRDTTPLDERSLRGEIDEAQERTPALEAWILAATREVPDQAESAIFNSGLKDGVPVLVIDWKTTSIPALAAMLAWDPETTEKYFGPRAGILAKQLAPAMRGKFAEIRRELEAWQIGFELLRERSLEQLRTIRADRREATAVLNQAVKGPHFVRRVAASKKMTQWWFTPGSEGAPLCVVGNEGVGKTWATFDWLEQVEDQLPITLVVPASAMPGLTKVSATGLVRFLGERLHELTRIRDPHHWRARAQRLLLRPHSEGPAFLLVLDGLNQEPQFDWKGVLNVLQTVAFRGRVRVVVTTRKTYFHNELGELKSLADNPDRAPVEEFSDSELDAMLSQHGLTRSVLNADLLERARNPRLFNLVVRMRDRLKDSRQITVHRLLFEHGRDTLGERAWSDEEWQRWLREVARRAQQGITAYSRPELAATASDSSLGPSQVSRRLSEIVDGAFTRSSSSGTYELDPTLVAHALGAALLERLAAEPDPAKADDILGAWLEPIAGLDQRAELLRAAVSIALESGVTGPTLTLLVTAWLNTQNPMPAHQAELLALAPSMPDTLLDVLERSNRYANASARLATLAALRSLDRSDSALRDRFVARATRWLSVVARGMATGDAEEQQRSAKRLEERIGPTANGKRTVLGVSLEIVARDTQQWGANVPAVLEGFPLQHAVAALTAGALSALLSPMHPHWEALKWMCLLNEVDPYETAQALRDESLRVLGLKPESGVNPLLVGRLAGFLLYLTGFPADHEAGTKIDTTLDSNWSYTRDYLDKPGLSFFELERRHAPTVLADDSIDVIQRAHRMGDLWLDPTFEPTPEFRDALGEVVRQFPLEKLYVRRYATQESHAFERLQVPLARCAPHALASLWREWARGARTADPASRLWRAWNFTDALLLHDAEEASAAQQMRAAGAQAPDQERFVVSNELMLSELLNLDAFDQAVMVIEGEQPEISDSVKDLLDPLEPHHVDLLVKRYRDGTNKCQRDLLDLLSTRAPALSDDAWNWVAESLDGLDEARSHLAFSTLGAVDAARLGRELLRLNWQWQPTLNPSVGHEGSSALVAATLGLPFDQVWPRVAPWWWLEAARIRGADPVEVAEAASAFDTLIRADTVPGFDAGAELTIRRRARQNRPLPLSVRPLPEVDADSAESLSLMFDDDARNAAFQEARKVAWSRIEAARNAGSSLIATDMKPEEFEMVFRLDPRFIDRWIEGHEDLTDAFTRRVQLAELPFLALCEVLLTARPAVGVSLWRALRKVVRTLVLGGANVPEFYHLAFAAPDSPEVESLRQELIKLDASASDQALYEVALAASWNGRQDWLRATINEDSASPFIWRQQRAITLSGFVAFNELPVADAWCNGPIEGALAQLQQRAARQRWLEACAHHWWREYWRRDTPEDSYAAWVLFRACADRRANLWFEADAAKADVASPLHQRKRWHARANRKPYDAGLDKSSLRNQRKFLGLSIDADVAPWRQ